MKNLKKILLLILVTSLFNRCTDHVDYEAIEGYQITSEIYFQQEADYDAALVGTYDVLQWLFFNIQLGAIASEITLCGGESATDYIGIQQIDDMTHYPENNVLRQIWQFLYEGVNRANYMEENKANIDFEGKEAMYGEVYFLRAYYYFELVKFFGDVPLFTEARLTAGQAGTLTRTPKDEVYAQIELDLQNAIASLPNSQSQVGKVNKYTAYALLGKVLLYQDKFAEAASALDNVIGVLICESFFSKTFTVSITSKPCLAHEGQEIILTPRLRKPNDFNISFPIVISLTGSSDKEILIVSPIPFINNDPIPIDDFILPGIRLPASVIPRWSG